MKMRSGTVRVVGIKTLDGVQLDNEKEAAELKAEQNHHTQGDCPALGAAANFASKPHKHSPILFRCRFSVQVTGLYRGMSIFYLPDQQQVGTLHRFLRPWHSSGKGTVSGNPSSAQRATQTVETSQFRHYSISLLGVYRAVVATTSAFFVVGRCGQ